MLRKKNLYIKGTTKNFKISRSKVDLFINCKRCFWLDRVKGLGMIQPPPFTLNNAVDSRLKNEFNHYRNIQQPHPIFLENGLLLRPLGNTIYLMPPYCIKEETLYNCYEKIIEILS